MREREDNSINAKCNSLRSAAAAARSAGHNCQNCFSGNNCELMTQCAALCSASTLFFVSPAATLGAAVKTRSGFRSRSRRSSKWNNSSAHVERIIFNFQFSISNDKHKVARGKHVQPALGGLCWIYTVTKTICCPYGMYTTHTHTHTCAWYLCK